jgi:hypothetical protein
MSHKNRNIHDRNVYINFKKKMVSGSCRHVRYVVFSPATLCTAYTPCRIVRDVAASGCDICSQTLKLSWNLYDSRIGEISVIFREPLIYLNRLKPTGHVMHKQFNIQQLYALPTLYLCVLYLSEDKQRLVPLTA